MLGARLVKLRGEKTQKEVAEKLGISRSRYSHYENNIAEPSNELLQRMSELYCVSVDYLLGRSDNEFNSLEKALLDEVTAIPIDEIIQKYPLKFMGNQLDLTVDDKRAILAFLKVLWELKKQIFFHPLSVSRK